MVNDSPQFRPARAEDAGALAAALLRNRDHMGPWSPYRPADFFTPEAQATLLSDPSALRWLFVDGPDVVGQATLSTLVLGPFRSASLGYWTDAAYTGRGLATRAVEEVCRAALEDLGLHRIEASTMPSNIGSQRVLGKCGFGLIGTAPRYLHIDGAWRDHHLYQRILHDGPPNRAL
ncbi:GNAT family N-acetyltransferase [Streptomyces sp. NBC_01716]|uniref:GNAT family N-acetyltransferase n=1 Tax=Streptomyces sp. NBC_01716 TaxID=2975917 RepID=UPI002E33A16D|nr:GNAT family protein [Streptomyces sp. NBC_01716]